MGQSIICLDSCFHHLGLEDGECMVANWTIVKDGVLLGLIVLLMYKKLDVRMCLGASFICSF